MATYVKGNAVANATSYELAEKNANGTYSALDTANEINFELEKLGLLNGNHTLVVKAKAEGYEDSDYSNEVVYTVRGASKNLINENDPDWYVGRLSPATGTESDQDKTLWYTTGYIPVTAGTNYVVSATYTNGNRMNITGSGARWYFYDEDKTFLGQATGGYFYNDGVSPRTASEGATYVRLSIQNTYTLAQLEKGTTPTEYEPYSE